MNYSSRFFLYGPVGLFAILMLGLMGYWWIASGAFSKKLDAMNGHEVAPGLHFSFARKSMTGFPFRLDSELEGLHIEIETAHGPAIWTAEHFALHSLTYGRKQFLFEAAGKQHVEWHNDAGQRHTYDFLPGSLRASAIANGHGVERFDLDLIADDSTDIAAARVQVHLRKDPKIDALDLVFSADNVHFAPYLKPAFGPDMKRIAVNALISPGSSFDGFLGGRADWRNAVQNWHARNGGLLVNELVLNWGALNATAKGALAVDEVHRPLGALHLQVMDWQKLARQLSTYDPATGYNNGLAAGLATFAADAHAPADQLGLTVSLKDGILFIGPVPADLLSPLY